MVLPRSFIGHLARELVRELSDGWCEFANPQAVLEHFEGIILDELSLEDEIDAETRELLNQYSEFMRRERIPYQEMFWKVKRKILAERKAVSAKSREAGERTMKVSRDKVVEMSHKLAAALPRLPGARLKRSWNDVRLEMAHSMTETLMKEERIDRLAQQKISSHQRDIAEGTEEWNVLYRRYYQEEMKRCGIDIT